MFDIKKAALSSALLLSLAMFPVGVSFVPSSVKTETTGIYFGDNENDKELGISQELTGMYLGALML